MKILLVSLFKLIVVTALSQSPNQIFEQVRKRQEQLESVSYSLLRQDTLVTGDIRTIRGHATLVRKSDEPFFHAHWRGFKSGDSSELIYTGEKVIELNHLTGEYAIRPKPSYEYALLGQPGGQVIFPEIIILDTAGMEAWTVKKDDKNFFLQMTIKDYLPENVTNRYKVFTIDKKLMLPVGMRFHQETLDRVQDLNYQLSNVRVNFSGAEQAFAGELIPPSFKRMPTVAEISSKLSVGIDAPKLDMPTFDDQKFSLPKLKGKLVLLDFWEIWCGPCIQSFPSIQRLDSLYKNRGLEVIGVSCDTAQLNVAKKYVKGHKIKITMVAGNARVRSTFGVTGLPYYVLIDRNGKIAFAGHTEELEEKISKLL